MEKKLILACAGLTLLVGCQSGEQDVKDAIAEANYCETVTDCVDVGGKCPFDCYIFVNEKESGRIKTLVEGFDSQCTYSCMALKGVACDNHKCVPVLDTPPQADPNIGPEGNPGAACTADTECVTPDEYLIRSSCPFESKCIEGTCRVSCPMMNPNPDAAAEDSWKVTCSQDADCDCRGAAGETKECKCADGICVATY